MNLDARSITIGLSVVLLAAIAWVLVSNNDDDPATTTVVAGTTTSAPTTEGPTTDATTTTTPPSTTAAASTTSTATTTTTPPTTTTSVAPTTSSPTRSTVTIPPPLEEPDLTMCRENDIPDRQCRWVGVEYPKITADPEEEPLRWLRQYADFLDWTNANPEMGHALKDLAATGDLLEELTDRARSQLEAGNIGLPRTTMEGPVAVSAGDGVMTLEAILVRSHVYTVNRDRELVRDETAPPPTRWRFELLLTEDGWRASSMESTE